MTIPPTTQDEYVAGLAPGLRDVAQRLRAAFHEAAPEATEAIKYGMPAFQIDGSTFVYFAVWTSAARARKATSSWRSAPRRPIGDRARR